MPSSNEPLRRQFGGNPQLNALLEELKDRVIVPAPPAEGTHVLQSVDGVLSWVEAE